MADDLVSRLEGWAGLVSSGYEVPAAGKVMHEAAAALEAKDAQIARLREALVSIQQYYDCPVMGGDAAASEMANEAAKALEETGNG